ncbi:MAG: MotA/TolQ/ExbB proton channel family protein [Thermodesulfobacteriota bacterium]
MDLVKLMHQGWIATYPLILFSILTVAILAERMFAMRDAVSSTKTITSLLLPHLTGGDLDSAISISDKHKKSLSARIYHPVLTQEKGKTLEEVSAQLDEKRFEEVHNLRQNIWVLGTIASSAPFVGLLGTVIGIIKSFHSMAVMGTGGFSVVAGGISEALVATAAGLLVAIVAVIAYNYLQTKIANINTEIKINSAKFLEAYKQGKKINGNREV